MPIPKRVSDDATSAMSNLRELAGLAQPMQPTNDGLPAAPTIDPTNEPGVPASQVQTQEPEVPQAPAPVDLTILEQQLARERQRNESLAGRMQATVAETAEMRGKVAMLESLIAKMRTEQQPAPAAPVKKEYISAKERAEYGDEFIQLAAAAAREEWEPIFNTLLARLETAEQKLGGVQRTTEATSQITQQSALDRYYDKLNANPDIPNWVQVNSDPDFLEWLNNQDVISGQVRASLLKTAFERFDDVRTAAIFRQFMQETGRVPNPAADAAPSQGKPRVDPATLAAPGNAAPAPQNTRGGNKGKVWTTKEVSAVYDNKMKGKITQEAFAKQEAEITQAYLEGRIKD